MARTHRLTATAAVVVCLIGTQWTGVTAFAAEEATPSSPVPTSSAATTSAAQTPRLVIDASRFTLDDDSSTLAQRRGFRGRGGRNDGAQAAIVVGTLAVITGAALLVYANRPECRTNQSANACGYGTKVIGGSVLSAGFVGILAGTITWR
jgi:hypothetical protein